LKAYVEDYNQHLKVLRKTGQREGKLTMLETVLCNLSPLDLNKLMPSSSSLERLRDGIFDRITDNEWLLREMASLEYEDGFSFKELIKQATKVADARKLYGDLAETVS
jgi:hypothetical protein